MAVRRIPTQCRVVRPRPLELQDRLSSFDLNKWIFSHFPVEAGQRWLDLGCGRGKQTRPLSESGASVVAVDLSAESLATLHDIPNVETVHCSLDEIGSHLSGQTFDRAIGSYSLYCANNPTALFETVRRLLTPKGGLFFCGPEHGNNLELRSLVAEVTGKPITPSRPAEFMEQAHAICESLFAKVEVFSFENEVRFETADELVAYWRSHNLFDPVFEQAFERAASDGFINRKRGIGIRARC